MKTAKLKILSTLAALSLIAGGCGNQTSTRDGEKTASSGSQAAEAEIPQLDGSHIQGHYRAMFQTLNPSVNGTIPGSANFFRKDDRLYAYVRLFAGRVSSWHQQYVYTGSRCPTMSDDTNADGFIDIQEAEQVLGKILIPLDSDISTQSSGRRFFPLADPSGSYSYERMTSFARFLSDLRGEDPDPTDDTVKLAPDEPLVITGKTALILGIDAQTVLPDTVVGKGRFRPFQVFPIACGVFEKVGPSVGRSYDPTDLGRTAEVNPDQDRPAPSDSTTSGSTGGGTTGRGTGTNENEDGQVSDGSGNTHTTSGSSGSSSSGTTTGGTTTGGSTTTGGTTTGGSTGETTGGTNGESGGTGDSSSSSSSSSSTSSSTTTSSTSGTTTGGPNGL